MLNKRKTSVVGLALGGILAVALSGCTTNAPPAAKTQDSKQSTAASALLAASAFSSADYDPVDTPNDLADQSEVVASGRVSDVQVGPVVGYLGDDLVDLATVVVTIAETELQQGTLAPGSDGNVYVALVSPSDAEGFGALIPIGSKVVFYGNLVQPSSEGSTPINFFDAGRPAGQPLYGLTNPQSLVFDVSPDESGELVWPDAHAWADAPIEETLPGGDVVGTEIGEDVMQ